MFSLAMVWSIFLFIFKFYGPALLSSTEDAGAVACVFALPVGSPLARVMGNVYVFSRINADKCQDKFFGALCRISPSVSNSNGIFVFRQLSYTLRGEIHS